MNEKIIVPGKNIYPFSKENFDAVIDFHFIRNGIIKRNTEDYYVIYEYVKQIELFEFEFIIECIVENILIFENAIGSREYITIDNLCKYCIEAFVNNETNGSKARRELVQLLRMKIFIKTRL